MGACVSTHHKPSAMKLQGLFRSNDIKPLSPAPQKPPIINADLPPSHSPAVFGSKEETFFDSQAWLESDCDDDFMSVNGEFTPSRGNTPVHHNFSAGTPRVNVGAFPSGNNKPPVSPYQPSPNTPEKKTRLSDLFKESLRGNYDCEGEGEGEGEDEDGKVESPVPEMVANGLKTKRERLGRSMQGCFPSLLPSRSSSTNGRKMMSPSLNPNPNPVVV